MNASVQLDAAPPALATVYREMVAELSRTMPEAEAQRVAMRHLQQAGWYKTGHGWEQLHADLRDKVTMRQAEQQPDGTYVIRGVPCFYPNAVKPDDSGAPTVYSAADIKAINEATNRHIAAGGAKPALTRSHIHPLQRLSGTQVPAVGYCINFRDIPGRPGWTQCDLVGVDASIVEDYRARRLNSLSCGVAMDHGGFRRWGHVTTLGGEPPALAHLPELHVYSADYLCFSADTEALPGANMSRYARAKECFSAMAAAFAAMEAGEPGAQDKLTAAREGMQAFAGEAEHPDEEQDRALIEQILNEGGDPAANPATPAEGEPAPQENPDMSEQNFSAVLAEQTKVIGALKAKLQQQEFDQFCAKLESDGHQFDKDWASKQFSANIGNDAAITMLRDALQHTPKATNLAAMGQIVKDGGRTFSAPAETVDAGELKRLLAMHAPNVNFSDGDLKVATAFLKQQTPWQA